MTTQVVQNFENRENFENSFSIFSMFYILFGICLTWSSKYIKFTEKNMDNNIDIKYLPLNLLVLL